MRLTQGIKEIFFFPFYFVTLNLAGLVSFTRFMLKSQPAGWKKSDRLPYSVKNCAWPEVPEINPVSISAHSLSKTEKVLESEAERVSGRKIASGRT